MTGTHVAGERGILVFAGQNLVAVLVHLEADFYDQKGQWHLEAGFSPVPNVSQCFATSDDAIKWIALTTGIPQSEA